MASGFQNIGKIPELRRRILFTMTLLAVYRIGAFVTTPGVNRAIMAKIVNQASGTFLGLFNMFSGGALEQMSIFALGIMPYISASIILQLLTVVVPKLEQIQKEGEMGRRQINQYTRYGCVILSLIQSFFIARWLEGNNRAYAQFGQVVTDPGLGLPPADHGLADHRHGLHHVAGRADHRARHRQRHLADHLRRHRHRHAGRRRPHVLEGARRATSPPSTWPSSACSSCWSSAVIIFFERGQRRIPVQYAKRVVGREDRTAASPPTCR